MGGAGNPLDIAYRPKQIEVLQFKWHGKKYMYKGDAPLLLLAISPQQQPVLVAKAADESWADKHKYQCVKPFYVQLFPDTKGTPWSWPLSIESWLYGLPRNLMLERRSLDEMRARYTAQDRDMEDRIGSSQDPAQAHIDPQLCL